MLPEVVRQIAMVVAGWTLLSICAVWPIAWWMRRRAALNGERLSLSWQASLPFDRSAAPSSMGPQPVAGELPTR